MRLSYFGPRSIPTPIWGVALVLATNLSFAGVAQAQNWGDIKGQVIWGPNELPKLPPANVNKDKAHCLAKGPIPSEEYVVNPKNKGVRYCLVWLVDPAMPGKKLPIHPALRAEPTKPVVIDQPCCKFIPRVSAVRGRQPVEVKNPAPIPHNFLFPAMGINRLMPAGSSFTLAGIPASIAPQPYSCSIHGWMKGHLMSFNHPYFAVTDEDGTFTIPKAPAGNYELIVWQEGKGFLFYDQKTKKRGKDIQIKADGTTDLGLLKLQPPVKKN